MLNELINHNADLKRLHADGYEIAILHGHLTISNVPYVAADKTVKKGSLVSTLSLSGGDKTIKPSGHVVYFTGEHPCDCNGVELEGLHHGVYDTTIVPDIIIERSFSSKPRQGYRDYHHKMTTYIGMLEVHAQQIEPEVTSRTYSVISPDVSESPFEYLDNASGISGISEIALRVVNQKIGIIGLGGTGSYLFDMVAKTYVSEIHLFDKDDMLQHNAFRCPGAVSKSALQERQSKVFYYAEKYKVFHRGVIPHAEHITEQNLSKLDNLDFIFICIDCDSAKKIIVEYLIASKKPFTDVGIGIRIDEGTKKLRGLVRTTMSTPENRETFNKFVDLSEVSKEKEEDIYATNIQIAELNALNACYAVIKWKKYYGVYVCDGDAMHSLYNISDNRMTND